MTHRERNMRRGAGYTLLGAFHVMHAVAAMADNVLRDMHRGLDAEEKEWLTKRAKHYRKEAESIRVLAWRLINNNKTPGGKR